MQNVLSRPFFEDRIQYYFIDKRPEIIHYEVPEVINLRWVDSIRFFPKSLIQIIKPIEWYQLNAKENFSSHTNVNFLFDDYSNKDFDFCFSIPSKVLIIFLNTENLEVFKQVENLDRFFLISSDRDSINSQIKSSHILKSKFFANPEQLFEKLLKFTLDELNITSAEYALLEKERYQQAKEILKNFSSDKVSNFHPAINNAANVYQLLSLDQNDLMELENIEHSQRVSGLLDIALDLGILSQQIKISTEEEILNNYSLPAIILSYPYFNPDYQKFFKKTSKGSRGETKEKTQQVKYLRFLEQDINTYNYFINLKDKSYNLNAELFAHTAAIKQRHSLFLDLVGYLHSSFEMSPYIRVPSRGASLNKYISRLSPSQYRRTNDNSSLGKNISVIGEALSSNLSSKVVDFLGRYVDNIFAISDLPLEWLLIKDIPLAFLCDICRIPENPVTSTLAQYAYNSQNYFQVPKNILKKTLVICGASNEDPIFKRYQDQLKLQKMHGDLKYQTAHIQSKDEFFKKINEIRPDFLIIDTHGDFKNQEEGSYIWMGNEKVTGDDIVNNLPQIPLVILSCCWGTPIYGNSNTIAQAFFEKGSFSVLSTFLPVSIDQGLILYSRILSNLSYASRNGVHESWMNFISHNIRTSYINNLFGLVFDKFGMNVLDQKEYKHKSFEWIQKCMLRETRISAFNESKETVVKSMRKSCQRKVERLMINNQSIPDFMLYTHLGRGDLVKFSSWIKEQKDN